MFDDRADLAAALAGAAPGLSLADRVRRVRAAIAGRIVFTTSFGLEDQLLTHAIAETGEDVTFVTLDTGRLFPETYEVWAETERRYGVRVHAMYPAPEVLEPLIARIGINGFRDAVENRKACCHARKVEPLQRALSGASGWISGLRATQSAARAAVGFASYDVERTLLAIHPLFDWTRERVAETVRAHGVPYNRLDDRGFLSIGCEPCTRAVQPGEDERAGRWWWEQDDMRECGLHVGPDGRLRRAKAGV